MKIVLVVTDILGKSIVFISDAGQAYSLEETIGLVRDGTLKGLYPVKGRSGPYLRSRTHTPKSDHLDRLSISSFRLLSFRDFIGRTLSSPAFHTYWRYYQNTLKRETSLIVIDGMPRVAEALVKEKLEQHREIILRAAEKFVIDPYLLGAIIIDEIARALPIEGIVDVLALYGLGSNTSAGIAQVKTDTARDLIKTGYYNPDPKKFFSERTDMISRKELYQYIKKPAHSIFFAAARMRALIDEWKRVINLEQKPEIIATLYSLSYKKPHKSPMPNDRGLQIVGEFYPLAKKYLSTSK
jgi:hypothetical protein